jgi:2',3'-cyclic-nucleotide 2'-phosphodiesterase / 3'-nucleotidase
MGILRASVAALIFAFLGCGADIKITLLATTDLHGNLFPYDYYTAQPAERGLAKIATLIQAARTANPNNLLIDCGDTIQGTPLEAVYQEYVESGRLPWKLSFAGAPLENDPMMLAMNAIGYDAMVVGNHEFNFGLKNLARARSEASFPWISSNIVATPEAPVKPFAPYFLKTVAGVRIAVVGITTPQIPTWEAEEHYRGYRFESGVVAARRTVAEVREREHPDIVIVAAHSGLDGDAKENMVREIATEVPGIDAIVFGHSHQQLASLEIGSVLLMQPKNWGISLGQMDFVLEPKESGGWKVVSKSSRLIPVARDTAADVKIVEIGRPYHELAERYLSTPVADAPESLDSRLARVEDSALIDAIQQVQLFYSKADVSFASSFNSRVSVPEGPVTIRQIAALYVYENQLYVVEGNGKMVRDALENSARYYNTCAGDCSHGPLINPHVIGYNYDMAEGVDYEIDLTRPEGQRIRNLRWHGKPLDDNQPLRIAVNNYRAGGSAGYSMFHGAKIVWRSPDEIRDLVIQYYSEHKTLPAQPDNNWRVVPEAALRTLEREALAGAQTVTQQ